jgi:hypothetical protein
MGADLHHRLIRAMHKLGVDTPVEVVDQDRLGADDARRRFPSPTVLVNGQDLFGMPPQESIATACRIYPGPDAIPSEQEIVTALRATGIAHRKEPHAIPTP